MLFANLVQRRPTIINQPDGSVINAFVSGDEYYHRVHDDQGFTILQHPKTGVAVYAIPDENSIQPSDYEVGKVDPTSLGIEPNLLKKDPAIEARYREQQRLSENTTRTSTTGTLNNVVAFVRFNDQNEFPIYTLYNDYNTMFNATDAASLHDLYANQSNGTLDIQSHLYPNHDGMGHVISLQVSHVRDYYSPDTYGLNPDGYTTDAERDSRKYYLVQELIGLLDPYVPDDMNLDNDGDGSIDAITFIFRGNTDNWGDFLWNYHQNWSGPIGTLNGAGVDHFVFDFEMGIGVSVISHEMGHMIGAPDYYHYGDAPMGSVAPWNGISPVGYWDLMSSDNAQYWLTYTKFKYGHWFAPIPEIVPTVTPTTYTLTAIDQAPYSCYKIASTNPNQFYMVEYRRRTGRYDVGVPATGLIIYRVITHYGQNDLNGNSQGPPDEVYIYRPGGVVNTDGLLHQANFSLQTGRTEIFSTTDPTPWLYVNTSTTPAGNLVITDIGPSGGDTMTFTVRLNEPNVWIGSVSTDWGNAANWSLGVPTVNHYVEVRGSCPRYPMISAISVCQNLIIKAGASVTLAAANLSVVKDIDIFGHLNLNNQAGIITAGGDIIWEAASIANVTADAQIKLQGTMEFKSTSVAQLTHGTIEFYGNGDSYLKIYSTVQLNHLRCNKGVNTLYYSIDSTQDLILNGNFSNIGGSTFTTFNSEFIYLKGNYTNVSGSRVMLYDGILRLTGAANQTISEGDANSFFHHFVVDTSNNATVSLTNDIRVYGNFMIRYGILQSNNHLISVKGDWTNDSGVTGFIEGTGQVIFNGTADQICYGETFYTMTLDKTGGELIFPANNQTTCAHYDWTQGTYRVDGGTFTVNDLVDTGIYGNITLNSGSIIYNQEAGSEVDIRGNLIIHGGNFTINGGTNPCYFTYIDASSLTMSGGTLDFTDVGIRVSNAWPFTENISGGTIRTPLGFENLRPDFTPTGGTLDLYGTANSTLSMAAGSNLYNLTINKAARGEANSSLFSTDRSGNRETIYRNNAVTCSGTLDLNGNFTLTAGTFTAPSTMQVFGNWTNSAGEANFIEGSGSVEFNGNADQDCLYDEYFRIVYLNKSGGNLRISQNAMVYCYNYSWLGGGVDVVTGTFTANDLAQAGIYGTFKAHTGGTVNLYQDAASRIDLNGSLYNYGGIINIYGGSTDSNWSYAANSGVLMTSGVIDFKNRGIAIGLTAYTLFVNISGGILKTTGSFNCPRTNVQFMSGTLELYGAGNVAVGLGNGSALYNLTVNKAIGRDQLTENSTPALGQDSHQDQRVEGVYAGSDLLIRGTLLISQGSFDVNWHSIQALNNVEVYGTIKLLTIGNLSCGNDFIWYASSVGNITAGAIQCGRHWRFDAGSNVPLTGSTTTLQPQYNAEITTGSTSSWFGNLDLSGNGGGAGSIYTMTAGSTYNLDVRGTFTVNSDNTLDLTGHTLVVAGTATINAGGGVILGNTGTLLAQGDLVNSGTLNVGNGYAQVNGSFTTADTAVLSITTGSFIHNAPLSRSEIEAEFSANSGQDRTVVELRGAIHLQGGLLEITNNIVLMRAHADRVFTGGIFRVGGGFTAAEAGAFHQDGGTLELVGNQSPMLDVSNQNYVYNLTLNKAGYYYAYLQSDLIIKGNLTLTNGGIVANNHHLTVGGNWTNSGPTFIFIPGTGSVTFNKVGGTQGVFGQTNFYDVTENHSNGAALLFNNTVSISHTLTVHNGVWFVQAATIGTLSNLSPAAEVSFYGNYTSTIQSYSGGGSLKALILAHVTVSDIATDGIYGNLEVDTGILELHQDAAQVIDLNGYVTVTGNGRLDVYGGSLDCYIGFAAHSGITMDSGELNIWDKGIWIPLSAYTFSCNITGGVIRTAAGFINFRSNFTPSGGTVECTGNTNGLLRMAAGSYFNHLYLAKTGTTGGATISLDTDIQIHGNLTLHSGTLSSNAHAISLYGYWVNDAGAAAFTESTGTVSFLGNLAATGLSSNETFYNLTVLNTSGSASGVTIAAAKQMTVTNNLVISGGTLSVAANAILSVSNNAVVNNTGKLSIAGDGYLALANAKSLTINNGAVLEVLGTSGHTAKITHSIGYYGLNIESGGTLSAEYAIFEYMNASGVNIKTGALVDATHSLHYSTFRNGANAGTLLTVNNAQSFVSNGSSFPANTWGGTSNVTKTLNQGNVTWGAATGTFAGAAYENDTYSRISWSGGILPDLQIVSGTVNHSSLYVCDPVTYSLNIRNPSTANISIPFTVGIFYNSPAVPPEGAVPDQTHTFASLAAGASASWTFTATSSVIATQWNSYFRVDAGNAISESNETNNTSAPLTVSWLALPAVEVTAITYDDLTERVILNWTYPTSVNNYRVYRSPHPDGPFDVLVSSPLTGSYSEPVSGSKYFYRIVAVKTWQ